MNSLIERKDVWKNKFPRAGNVGKQTLELLKFPDVNGKSHRCRFKPVVH